MVNWIAWCSPSAAAERLALPGVPDALVHAALGQPGGQRRDRHPALVQDLQELGVAPAALAEQVLGRHPAAGEGELAGIRGAPADLGVLRTGDKSGRPVRNDDRRDLLAAVLVAAGDGQHGHQRGDRGTRVGDEGLGAVDHPGLTRLPVPLLEPGGSAHAAGDIGSAAGLGQAERGQPLPRAQFGQPPAALCLGAEPVDGHRAERHPGLQRDRDRGIHPGQFLQGQAEGEVVAAHAAVLLGERQPEQAELAHLGHDVVRELAAFVVAADDRRDDVAGELGDGVPQVLLLRRELVTDHRNTFASPGGLGDAGVWGMDPQSRGVRGVAPDTAPAANPARAAVV